MTRRRRDLASDPYAGSERGDRQPPLGIQLGELVPWIRAHPVRGVITLLLALGAIGTLLNPPIEAYPNRLSPGDCLYARTPSAEQKGPGARPIGESGDVEDSINNGVAVRAACGLSHGHEVTAIMPVALPGHGSLPPSAGTLTPVEGSPVATSGGPVPSAGVVTSPESAVEADRAAIRASVQAVCDAAFPEFVGHPLAGSEYVTFAVIPSIAQLDQGPQLALCLVARADGQWMTSPAKHSGS